MSNFRDKLKGSQGESKSFPKFKPDVILETKVEWVDKKPVPAFRLYQDKKEFFIKKTIEGILIGQAMIMGGFDQREQKGYKSSPYFSKAQNVAVFKSGMTGVTWKGTAAEAEMFIRNRCGNVKKRQIIYIATVDKKSNISVVAIETNLSIAIDQMNVEKDRFLDYSIVLTPTLFDENIKLSKKTREVLDIMFKVKPDESKTQMAYADIKAGQPMTNEFLDSFPGIDNVIDNFVEWKKYVSLQTAKDAGADMEPNYDVADPEYAERPGKPEEINLEYDDLPF